MSEAAESLTSRLAGLNPFSKGAKHEDSNDDKGEEITANTVAGGGHGARQSGITKNQLRVSHALKSFLVENNVMSKRDAGLSDGDETTPALRDLLDKPHINVPAYLTDRSYPLPEYFISSSHNTYLMAHQLFGESSSEAYKIVLGAGARCVEIDAWDNDENVDEPKVTHGYTLVSHISFRSVCEVMRDAFDKEVAEAVPEQGRRAAPILLSLENHCNPSGQLRLVQIMKEVWGDRLLSKAVREEGHREEQDTGEHVTLEELGAKIGVIVEHHIPGIIEDNEDDSDHDEFEDETEEQRKAQKAYKDKKKAAPVTIIIPELAALGVYAQSVKPTDNSWYEQQALTNGPDHHLINISESKLLAVMPGASTKIARHNAHHLMRVFPKGTRISSANLDPVRFWGVGAHICALNWQTFGASMQINEALFSGSDGYVLKPEALRAGGSGKLSDGRKKSLRLHIAGATEVPCPEKLDADDIKPYVTCMLVHPDDLEKALPKRKTKPYHQHKLGFLHKHDNPPPTDPIWDETLEWEFEDNEMAFLRILIKSDESFATNPVLCVAAVRIMYITSGWSFIRMLDLKGRETKCSLLVKFDVVNV
ncbi:phosphoinositide phospholipase C-1 [Coleophoma cylindrospora]|uniref:Phosphoinositide phospholipase C n=1 Tax=Coleophoma cylindrospora TaxID=1849047 RepID=A0A3D8QLB6_9HELO|nr:phosphoinositide phospholipase C-1 [Coleophoma cylindrospora]